MMPPTPATNADVPPHRLRWAAPLGLLLGVGLWAWLGVEDTWTGAQVVGIAIAGAAAILPPSRRSISHAIDRFNSSPRSALVRSTASS